jgi:hypothetical protein
MKVILSIPDEGYSINTSCALNMISTFLSIILHVLFVFEFIPGFSGDSYCSIFCFLCSV